MKCPLRIWRNARSAFTVKPYGICLSAEPFSQKKLAKPEVGNLYSNKAPELVGGSLFPVKNV